MAQTPFNSRREDLVMLSTDAIRGEDSTTGSGGALALRGGNSGGADDGANVTITGGIAGGTGAGGDVSLQPGTGTSDGSLILANSTWPSTDAAGVLTSDGVGGLTWGAAGGVTDLQGAYDGGNAIVTSGGNAFDVSGPEEISLTVSGTDAGPLTLTLGASNAGAGTGTIALSASDGVAIDNHVLRGGATMDRFQILGGTQAAVTGDGEGPSVYLKAQDGAAVEGAFITVGNGTLGSGAVTARGGDGISGGNGGSASLVGGAGDGAGNGGQVSIVAGGGGTTGGDGAFAFVSGGLPSGTGNADGGGVVLTARNGRGTGTAGPISLIAGNSGTGATGDGADVTVTAGNAVSTDGAGGSFTVSTGDGTGTGDGGDITLSPGTAGGSGADGAVRAMGPMVLPSYTVAGVPSVTVFAGGLIYVTDETGGPVPAYSDGTNWRRFSDGAIVS